MEPGVIELVVVCRTVCVCVCACLRVCVCVCVHECFLYLGLFSEGDESLGYDHLQLAIDSEQWRQDPTLFNWILGCCDWLAAHGQQEPQGFGSDAFWSTVFEGGVQTGGRDHVESGMLSLEDYYELSAQVNRYVKKYRVHGKAYVLTFKNQDTGWLTSRGS